MTHVIHTSVQKLSPCLPNPVAREDPVAPWPGRAGRSGRAGPDGLVGGWATPLKK